MRSSYSLGLSNLSKVGVGLLITLTTITSTPSFLAPNPAPPVILTESPFVNLIKRATLGAGLNLSKQPRSLNHSAILLTNEGREDIQSNSLSGGAGTFEHAHEELFKVVPEVTATHRALSLLPAFVVIFGSFSAFVKERLYIGEAILAVGFGIILGPYVSGVFDPRSWNDGIGFDDMTLELTRIVIALSVFAVGVELPKAYIMRHWRSLAYLLGPIMLIGWLISGALIFALIPALNFLESLVVAAAVTPTDPILAASVVGKGKYAQKHVPAHLRHLLQAESGCNDGAAFPFLYLAMFLLLRGESSIGRVISSWVLLVILYQIFLGILIGTVIGIAARKTLKFCKRRSMIDRESMVAMYVALALLTTGVTTLAGSDDLLAAFACGAAFAWDDWFTESIEASNFSGILDLLINCATFIYVGATIPFASWKDLTLTLVPWRLILLGISILVLRRLPAMLILQKLIPDLKTHREAVFCGHFGPIGVGAIFISTLAAAKLPTPAIPPESSLDVLALTVQPLIYLLVLFSIFVHGLSIPFFTLGRNVHSRVHSMTRTWTQASGNEPSWLSRVKRVDRVNDETSGDIKAGQQPFEDKSRDSPPDPVNRIERGEHQISDDQITRVEGESRHGKETQESTASEFHSVSPPREALTPSPSSAPLPSPPSTGRHFSPTAVGQRPGRGLNTRVGLLRLGSTIKRTAEEQEAHRREKLLRDEWCRRERVDNVKRDEERVYKSGRHIIIERGDGDEVEVRDLDPSSDAIAKARRDPKLSLATIPKERFKAEVAAMSQEGSTGRFTAARKLEAAKRIVHRSIRKHQSHEELDMGVERICPGPLASSQSNGDTLTQRDDGKSLGPLDINAGSVGPAVDQSQLTWIEGDKLVTESKDGEDVHVEPRFRQGLRTLQSLPILASQDQAASQNPSVGSTSSLPNLLANSDETKTGFGAPLIRKNEEEDEWEEDDNDEEADWGSHWGTAQHRTLSKSGRRRPSSRVARRPRWVTSGSHVRSSSSGGGLNVAESDARPGLRSSPPRVVGFTGIPLPGSRSELSRPHNSSRTSSPSRSIRFAEHPVRPNRGTGSSKRKSYKKGRTGLLGLVAATRESSRRSSIAADSEEQPPSQTTSSTP